jgi:glutathione S-transferase
MIQLYHRWHCPYSARVRDFIDEQKLGPKIEYVELGEVERADTNLAGIAGRSQVPCLVVDGKPILESSDIVQWLKENLVNSQHSS